MNRYTPGISTIGILCLLIMMISRQYPTKTTECLSKNDKTAPNDYFFLQRVGPTGRFNFKAYQSALEQASQSVLEKDRPEGLNQDWQSRGPSNIGARINTIAVNPDNENIIYTGFAGGGIFKTTDDGVTWSPIFDNNSYLAIGDITLDPSNPSTVYVGTGDPNITGFPFIGNGIYKSTDSGETWENIGLQEESIISKIIVHPDDSGIIYASAMGIPFVRNDKRGFYKSVDGGQSWEQKLFVSTEAGIIDFVLSPTDPNTIYAASWNRIRNNHESLVAGQDAKIFKSTDGGDNWIILSNGLPQTDTLGRIGLAISSTNPNKLYAVVVDANNQLENIYKTTNAGASWEPTINWEEASGLESQPLGGFGWYFGKIRVNPINDEEIYLLGVTLWKSSNGGHQWEPAIPFTSIYSVHADKHDLVFLPSGNRLLATDGGLYKTNEEEMDWLDHDQTPCTQFYRVAYNPHLPGFYFGGAQDNGSIGGESDNSDWIHLYGGDGFQLVFHPTNPSITYAESQNGHIVVSFSEEWGSWSDATSGIDGADRRNWDMQFILSPHNPNTMYTGTYRVYKSTEGAIPNWYPVSDDLTDGQIYADRFHTITSIAESKPQQGLIYVGTTDGNVWRSDYGGDDGVWRKLSDELPDDYVTAVVPSPDNIDKVYVSLSGYKENDFGAKIFRSANRGNTWENIAGDLPDLSVNDILVMPMHNDSVIVVGTDGGVFITRNGGANWYLMGNMPIVPVYDLEYNQATNEIIAGTFARSIMTYSGADINTFLSPTNSTYISKKAIHISPNPASLNINIRLDGLSESVNLTIYNIKGKQVFSNRLNTAGETIDISHLPKGVYTVIIKGNNLWGSRKLIVL